jgi:cobalamin biosynthesis protein CobD/CbiB
MLTSAIVNPAIWLVLVILAVAAIYYAWRIVRPLRHRNPAHGQTAWLVVVGVAVTVVAYTFIVAASSNIVTSLEHAVLLLSAFAVSGLPMIVEYIDDHLRRDEEERSRSIMQEISQILNDKDE